MIAWMLAAALEVVVPGPAGPLAGTLTLPAGRGPFPAVVTATGSGAHFRDGNRTPEHPYRPFRHIADALAACGVATLRLDDRGVGGSAGNADAATAEDTAADTAAAVRFLRARKDVDPKRVGLIGHSYGGDRSRPWSPRTTRRSPPWSCSARPARELPRDHALPEPLRHRDRSRDRARRPGEGAGGGDAPAGGQRRREHGGVAEVHPGPRPAAHRAAAAHAGADPARAHRPRRRARGRAARWRRRSAPAATARSCGGCSRT